MTCHRSPSAICQTFPAPMGTLPRVTLRVTWGALTEKGDSWGHTSDLLCQTLWALWTWNLTFNMSAKGSYALCERNQRAAGFSSEF